MNSVSLKIASWNVEGRLSLTNGSSGRSATQIIESIRALDADVLVLVEAHSETSLETLPVRDAFTGMGYDLRSIPYEDDFAEREGSYGPRLSLLLLSRLAIRECKSVRLGNHRNALLATVECAPEQTLRVIGVHLDDREEQIRVAQVRDIANIVGQSPVPTVVLGDFNAMHGEDVWPSKFLRTRLVRAMAQVVLPGISVRAVDMARGEALGLLESATDLIDADERHQPTTTPKMRGREWMPSIRLMQIDHIFRTNNITVDEFSIAGDGGADHRAISARVSIDSQ